MKSRKAPGPTGMTSDLMKGAVITGREGYVVDEGEIPKEWKSSVTVPIYKGKGDALECGKYRGIRLLEHGMKLLKKVSEEVKESDKSGWSAVWFLPRKANNRCNFYIEAIARNCIMSLWTWRWHSTEYQGKHLNGL